MEEKKKNWEVYEKEIRAFASLGRNFAVDLRTRRIESCNARKNMCEYCLFRPSYCISDKVEWLYSEYDPNPKHIMKYKDFYGSSEYDEVSKTFYGKILNTHDLITYESDSPNDLYDSFVEAVKDYIKFLDRRMANFNKRMEEKALKERKKEK